MSKTYRGEQRARRLSLQHENDTFRCRHCKCLVGQVPSGGRHRNHCPACLYSRHLDQSKPGDRSSDCGAMMRPIGACTRPNGEYMLIHQCLGCGMIRRNRIAADDDYEFVLSLVGAPGVEFALAEKSAEAQAGLDGFSAGIRDDLRFGS